jgi:RNA polymerase sigma-70 factor (ECF subfamily)
MILAAAMAGDAQFTTSDEIAKLRRGEPDALQATILRYQHRLFRYLLRFVEDSAAADDLFQQTWMRVMENIRRYDAARSFEAWLFTLAHNVAIDYLRRRRPESLDEVLPSGQSRGSGLPSENPDALEQALEWERASIVSAAMRELPAIHREVLTLRFEEDLKLEQIAEIAQIPLSTVKSRLHRALDGLRTQVEHRFGKGGTA